MNNDNTYTFGRRALYCVACLPDGKFGLTLAVKRLIGLVMGEVHTTPQLSRA
jgi:hypothetical protein